MTKTLTEQWKNGELPSGFYYVSLRDSNDVYIRYLDQTKYSLYFECFKEALAPVPDYMDYKRLMYDSITLDNAKIKVYELVSKTEQLVQKVHILNEQNTKQYNELCEEIKKNNILKKQLAIATKALKKMAKDNFQCAEQALEEIELREAK